MATKKAAATIDRAGRPNDPVFRALVEHAESERTAISITALRELMQRLDANLMQMAIHDDGTLNISITAGDMHYAVWFRPDERTDVESYVDITDEFGDKTWADVDRYNSSDGVTMANGHSREGGE